MKKFEATELSVSSLHDEGYGLADADGQKFGVFGALPNEIVVADPFTRRKKRIFARTSEVLTASSDRVVPACGVADVCGGCTYQHMSTEAQHKLKLGQLQVLLAETPPLEYLPTLSGPVVGYRSKARLGVRYVSKKDKVLVGFREKMNPYITETAVCPVLATPVNGLLSVLSELITELSIREQIPQIEVAIGDSPVGAPSGSDSGQGILVALSFRHLEPLSSDDLEKILGFGREHQIAIYLQPGNETTVTKLYPESGEDRLYYSLPDYNLKMAFHPYDFTQVNVAINRQMIPTALGLLNLSPDDVVLDLFCGIGNFSLPLAHQVRSVIGLEGAIASVERARENARMNDIHNAEFAVADLYKSGLPAELALGVNKVLIDPPRSGALEVLDTIINSKISQIVYVSCNPVTLARDIRILVEAGFQLQQAGIIDMFPHTKHVESIASLSR